MEPGLPGFFLGLLRWYCNPDKLEEIEGDLEELYFTNTEEFGIKKARYYFAWNVIRCCKPYAWKRKIELFTYYFNIIMILNYLKIARRNLLKHKTFSLINIFGLSFSISVCLLIITIINDQLSHDNFHENGDRIYRVITDVQEKELGGKLLYASTVMPVAGALKNDYTGVEEAVRITKDKYGNIYAWDSSEAIHKDIEIGLVKLMNQMVTQKLSGQLIYLGLNKFSNRCFISVISNSPVFCIIIVPADEIKNVVGINCT